MTVASTALILAGLVAAAVGIWRCVAPGAADGRAIGAPLALLGAGVAAATRATDAGDASLWIAAAGVVAIVVTRAPRARAPSPRGSVSAPSADVGETGEP